VAKVLADKPVRAEALELALGKIWCPIKGVQGKRRAMEDRPWMFGKDLVVMAEFDEAETIDEIEFSSIPIWVPWESGTWPHKTPV
jgi:hypothetical protein